MAQRDPPAAAPSARGLRLPVDRPCCGVPGAAAPAYRGPDGVRLGSACRLPAVSRSRRPHFSRREFRRRAFRVERLKRCRMAAPARPRARPNSGATWENTQRVREGSDGLGGPTRWAEGGRGPWCAGPARQHSFSRSPRDAPEWGERPAGWFSRGPQTSPPLHRSLCGSGNLGGSISGFQGCAQVLCVSRRHSFHVKRVLPALASSWDCQVVPHVMVTKTRPLALQHFDSEAGWSFTSGCWILRRF